MSTSNAVNVLNLWLQKSAFGLPGWHGGLGFWQTAHNLITPCHSCICCCTKQRHVCVVSTGMRKTWQENLMHIQNLFGDEIGREFCTKRPRPVRQDWACLVLLASKSSYELHMGTWQVRGTGLAAIHKLAQGRMMRHSAGCALLPGIV